MICDPPANLKFVLLRGFGVWLIIISAESLHGVLRVILLEPLVGDFRARQIAVFSASLIFLTISLLFVRRLHAAGYFQLLAVGVFWVLLTIGFELLLGRFVFDVSWNRILSDYNILRGGLMPIGLVFLTLAPLIAAKLRRTKLFGDRSKTPSP